MFIVLNGTISIDREIAIEPHGISIKSFSRKPKSHSHYQLQPKVVEVVAERLAQDLGPVAFALTYQMAERVSSVYGLYEHLAPEIEDLERRTAFLLDRPTAPTEQFQPGDCWGEMALFLGHPLAKVKTIAVTETELLAITPAMLLEILDRDKISIETLRGCLEIRI